MLNHASGQPLPEWVTWDCCDQVHDDGTPCTGAAQSDYGRCLVHLDDAQLDYVMASQPDEALDARGARLANADLERVLAAVPRRDGDLHLLAIFLSRAVLTGDVSLAGATVEG